MNRRRLVFPALATLLTLARTQPAEACGAAYTYATLAPTQAVDGATGVAINAPLLLRASVWPGTYPLENYGQLHQFSVEVTASGQASPVAGEVSFFGGLLAWNPAAPLAPMTTYEVRVHVTNDMPAPDDATGPLDQQLTFTTGTASLAPLTFTSAPAYTFEARDYPSCPSNQMNDCGTCAAPSTVSWPSAIITLPTVSGGAVASGYLMYGWLTDGTGAIKYSARRDPGSTEPTVSIPLIPGSAPDEPCLHVTVDDATGQRVSTTTTCFAADTLPGVTTGGGGGAGGSGVGSAAGGSAAGSAAGSASGTAGSLPVDPTRGAAGTSGGASGATPGEDSNDGCSTNGRSGPGGGLLVGLAAAAAWQGRRRTRDRRR